MTDLELYDALETATDPARRDRLAAACHQRATAFAQAGQPSGHYHDPLGTYDYCNDPRCPRIAKFTGANSADPACPHTRSWPRHVPAATAGCTCRSLA